MGSNKKYLMSDQSRVWPKGGSHVYDFWSQQSNRCSSTASEVAILRNTTIWWVSDAVYDSYVQNIPWIALSERIKGWIGLTLVGWMVSEAWLCVLHLVQYWLLSSIFDFQILDERCVNYFASCIFDEAHFKLLGTSSFGYVFWNEPMKPSDLLSTQQQEAHKVSHTLPALLESRFPQATQKCVSSFKVEWDAHSSI